MRRIVGFAHNADFESITDADLRGLVEQRALGLARELVVAPGNFPTIETLVEGARRYALTG